MGDFSRRMRTHVGFAIVMLGHVAVLLSIKFMHAGAWLADVEVKEDGRCD